MSNSVDTLNDLPYWTKWVQLFATPIIAFIAACIAARLQYNQWKTANHKLNLDLLQRRIEVYDCINNAIGQVIRAGQFPSESLRDFDIGIGKAKFLFGSDIIEYVANLRAKLVFINIFGNNYGGTEGEERKEIIDKFHRYLREIYDNIDEKDQLFLKYMRFDEVR